MRTCVHMLTPMKQAPAMPDLPDDVLAVNSSTAAKMLGISRRYLYELIYAGEIKTAKLPSTKGKPNQHRIEISELRAFLARHRTTAA